ncbi:hypothetical protein TR13x_01260 [Caloranaerobacter sp. TR13]|uniref:DUF2905 domain-containing protein n=1 Tax=Caloranaerobacter sp. TR13 TaxID=1302151 RepID=UPI0006D3F9CF|nr:DUF2905 domain-containing protein [Caloranaerobacter sp. TR13]KPU28005.1 hypothetical protein TR13x_01260 [Caloranaerobacter sp. TR13]
MESLGRLLVVIGLIFIILGGFLIIFQKVGLGKLPGDIVYQKGNFTFVFPIVTSIVLSIILSIIINIISRLK